MRTPAQTSKSVPEATIPAFVDRSHTDYQQVIENLPWEDLKPRELAIFIKRKMDEEKQAQIAELLGVNRSMVTNHLALIDPPACIDDIIRQEMFISKTLYHGGTCIRSFLDERWCAVAQEIHDDGVALYANLGPQTKIASESGQAGKARSVQRQRRRR